MSFAQHPADNLDLKLNLFRKLEPVLFIYVGVAKDIRRGHHRLHVSPQIVDRLPDQHRSAVFDLGNILKRLLQVTYMAGGFGLLQARILADTPLDPVIDHVDQLGVGLVEGFILDFGLGAGKRPNLVGNAAVEVPPFLHQFRQFVPLLPALEPVLQLFHLGLLFGNRLATTSWTRTEHAFECVEQRRNMVVKLRPCERNRGGLLGVLFRGQAPTLQY